MIYSSFDFIFGFLPIVLAVYWMLAALQCPDLSKLWLIVASLFFYGYWDWLYVFLIVGSIVFNFVMGRIQLGTDERIRKKLLLWLVIIGNLALLCYFKYLNFLLDSISDITDGYQIEKIILPIGLSFYTFQQITYQVDAYAGRAGRYNLIDYSLFVSFFPQLIAGPIVHHNEMLPQFMKPGFMRPKLRRVLLGLCVFAVGAFKKAVIADGVAPQANLVFDAAAAAQSLSTGDAWLGTLAYGLQLYFDFSGYSDMCVGLGILFGIRLPFNFFSPFKARNMIQFWRRWHITLSREAGNLLYNPISLGLTRFAVTKRLQRWLIFVLSVALPTMFTWFLVGLWHGAGWNFILLGIGFGFCITCNHLANQFIYRNHKTPLLRSIHGCPAWIAIPSTFVAYLLIIVLFRADNVAAAGQVYRALFRLPGSAEGLLTVGVADGPVLWLMGAALVVVFALPNTIQYFAHYRVGVDALAWVARRGRGRWHFRFTAMHVIFCAILFAAALMAMAVNVTEFIYFDF